MLALQGDVREHLVALSEAGATAVTVRRERELSGVDALVIPGGESTTIGLLLDTVGLAAPLRARLAAGMPAFGSCAGMILLADRVLDGSAGQHTLGGLDVTVRRNAFGRQVDSFEADVTMEGIDDPARPVHAVFIRAPWVEQLGPSVQVLGRVEAGAAAGRIVAVRQGPVLATSFHPEVGGDPRVHRMFVQIVRDSV